MSWSARSFALAALTVSALCTVPAAQAGGPKPIPATRPETKRALEALKERTPRLPLPAVAEGEPSVNNGRMRSLYVPEQWTSAERSGRSSPSEPNPEMQLDYGFGVALFWIASRGNNCHYCLGHQELKLAKAGWEDDQVAALDCDWSGFDEKTQAALALARQLTIEPHTIADADISALEKHFSDREIVEMVHLIARYNATNRWTDSLGIPQDRSFRDRSAKIDTPTSPEFQETTSIVITAAPQRPALEQRAEVEARLADCAKREPRVALLSQADAEKALDELAPGEPQTNWIRALAYMPSLASGKVESTRAMDEYGDLDKTLKAQLAWATARENRAWYALGHARERLRRLGLSDDAIFELDAPGDDVPAGTREALALAHKLTATPQLIEDADIARLRQHYNDRQVAQIVYVVCNGNYFDRLTEALGLPLEG